MLFRLQVWQHKPSLAISVICDIGRCWVSKISDQLFSTYTHLGWRKLGHWNGGLNQVYEYSYALKIPQVILT